MCGEIPLPFLHFFLSFGRVCLRLVCWCARVRGCGCNPRGRDGTRLGRREEANVRVEGTGQDWEDEKERKIRGEWTRKDWEDEKERKNCREGTRQDPPFFLFLL